MGHFSFYISTLVVYFGIDLMAAWALNLQYGYAGVINFAFIVFQAAGAYVAATMVLGSDTGINSYQHYVLGAHLAFPLPLVAATVAGALLSAMIGLFAVRRIRRDYQAAVMLIVSLILLQFVSNDVHLFNGSNGLTGIPRPLQTALGLSLSDYQWVYALWVLALCAVIYVLVERLCRSSWGRSLRAIRDQEDAAASLGLNGTLLRLEVFIIGGAIAGLSGGLLVEFIGAWSPGSWGYAETFVIFTALLVGGVGNNRGMLLGTLIVPIIVLELPTFLPQFGYPGLIDAIEWMIIGLAWMIFLLVRPRGLLPEPRFHAPRDGRIAGMAARGAVGAWAARLLSVGRPDLAVEQPDLAVGRADAAGTRAGAPREPVPANDARHNVGQVDER
ncbi:MAG: branched-chain amino acid ABC transporter permease [Acidimicrobiales bacterium]